MMHITIYLKNGDAVDIIANVEEPQSAEWLQTLVEFAKRKSATIKAELRRILDI